MTESIILQVLKNLKIKNCEGFDRIPLRIFNEGAELLAKPLASLFKLSMKNERSLSNYWVQTKPPTITAKPYILPYLNFSYIHIHKGYIKNHALN